MLSLTTYRSTSALAVPDLLGGVAEQAGQTGRSLRKLALSNR
jgi:hypothetical protein